MKKKKVKKIIFFCIVFMFAFIAWYRFSNPASILKDKKIKEVGIYAIQNKKLWDLGYKTDDFNKADPQYGDFEYNAVFKGNALNKVLNTLKYASKSYYTLSEDSVSTNQGIYWIEIKFADDEGIILITKDLIEESKGKFIGYKYKGKTNPNKRWIKYENPRLGKILMELRTK